MHLPDLNVLLALAFEAHVHHPVARDWFENVQGCVVCRMTQSGFLRLASNPTLFGAEALTLSDAWASFDTLLEDERFSFALEPLGLEHMWRRLTMVESYSPKLWNDRYLAAFAVTGNLTLTTLDRALGATLRGVQGLEVELLGAV